MLALNLRALPSISGMVVLPVQSKLTGAQRLESANSVSCCLRVCLLRWVATVAT